MIWLAVSTLRMWFAVFSWTEVGREILSFKDVGACRVGMSLCGSLPRGALLVGHSFRWRFLIGMGGGACCVVFVGFAYLCLCSWVCHVGLLFWLTIHFGGVI